MTAKGEFSLTKKQYVQEMHKIQTASAMQALQGQFTKASLHVGFLFASPLILKDKSNISRAKYTANPKDKQQVAKLEKEAVRYLISQEGMGEAKAKA